MAPEPPRALLAEDCDDDPRLIRRTLDRAFGPTECLAVPDIETFRVALEYGAWHVVISDHSNPRCRPERMLEILDEDELSLPFLLVSGHVDAPLERTMRAAGARACIDKHEIERLVGVVKREVGRVAVRRRPTARIRLARRRDPLLVAALESLPAAAVLVDATGLVRHANAAAARMLGLRRRDCRGRPLRDWCTPQGGPEAAEECWGPALLRPPYRMPVPIEIRRERFGTGPDASRVVLWRRPGGEPPIPAPRAGPLARALLRHLAMGTDVVSAWARLHQEIGIRGGARTEALALLEAAGVVATRLFEQWHGLLAPGGGGSGPRGT